MRLEPTRITVAVLDPKKMKPLDDLGFKAGKRVVTVVVPEFRLNQLLRKHCKAFRPMRPIDMNTIRPSVRAKQADEPNPAEVKDLINEDDFANLYRKASGDEEETIEGGEVVEEPSVRAPRLIEPIGQVPAPDAQPEAVLAPLTFAEAQGLLSK